MAAGKRRIDPFLVISTAGLLFLIFLVGVCFGVLKIFPYRTVHDGFKALVALGVYYNLRTQSKYESNLWNPVRKEYLGAKGVTVHRPGQAFEGYTLYTSGHDQKAFLIDLKGRVVHRWHLPFDKVWEPQWRHNTPPKPDRIYIREAYLYPDGDILLLYVGFGPSPWGMVLVRADRQGRIKWKYARKVHHDLAVGPRGRIYTLTHRVLAKPPARLAFLPKPLFDDAVVVLSPKGKELKEVSILECFANSEFREMLRAYQAPPNGDIFHTNTVELVTPLLAARFPFASPGQVLVCFRNLNTLALIDLDARKVVWLQSGPWYWPHDPDLLPNGRMLIFDNLYKPGKLSRVVEFDPLSQKILWQYHGDKRRPLYSFVRSRQQMLPNGNILICESDGGRLLEVNRRKEIVWEFLNPVQEKHQGRLYIPVVSAARRYEAAQLRFLSPKTSGGR